MFFVGFFFFGILLSFMYLCQLPEILLLKNRVGCKKNRERGIKPEQCGPNVKQGRHLKMSPLEGQSAIGP